MIDRYMASMHLFLELCFERLITKYIPLVKFFLLLMFSVFLSYFEFPYDNGVLRN